MVYAETVPGLKAEVLINGNVCQEYEDGDEQTQDRQVVRYIEAVPGQNFLMSVKFDEAYPHPNSDVACNFYVDGKRVRSLVMHHSSLHIFPAICDGILSRTKEGSELRRLKFANLRTTEERHVDETLLKEASQLGTIMIQIQRVHQTGIDTGPRKNKDGPVSLSTVPEKALKGKSISVQTSYDPPRRLANAHYVTIEPIDPIHRPLYTFVFKYRTLSDLRAEHIIPNEDFTNNNETSQRDASESQLKTLLKRERERVQKLEKRLAARSTNASSSQAQSRIKRDRSVMMTPVRDDELSFVTARPAKRGRPDANTVVIDLLDD